MIQDPVFERTGGEARGRDGCRVPLPWSGTEPPYAFSPPGADAPPWLPQPDDWAALTTEAQTEDFGWLPAPAGVLDFQRDRTSAAWSTWPDGPDRDPGWQVLVASAPVLDGVLEHDAAAWLGRA